MRLRRLKRTSGSARRVLALTLLAVLPVTAWAGYALAKGSQPTKPPKPVFTHTPPDPSGTATSSFAWTDAQPGVTYQCSEENGSFRACTTPRTYVVQTTNGGLHQFAVRALDATGNVSDAASYGWKVEKGSGQDFTISGDAVGLLYPGGSARPIVLTLTNPNATPITVTALVVTADFGSLPAGCGSSAFSVTQSNVATQNVVVPANSSVTLPSGSTSAPTVAMADQGSQDVCRNAHISFSYSGSAHS